MYKTCNTNYVDSPSTSDPCGRTVECFRPCSGCNSMVLTKTMNQQELFKPTIIIFMLVHLSILLLLAFPAAIVNKRFASPLLQLTCLASSLVCSWLQRANPTALNPLYIFGLHLERIAWHEMCCCGRVGLSVWWTEWLLLRELWRFDTTATVFSRKVSFLCHKNCSTNLVLNTRTIDQILLMSQEL